ncbi:MAG: hypothetical protein JWM38_146 [Sphingomonas bacterium]|jgi:hypothetical protein|nr:hypothetical protein [Sphingomonas bacterium]
MTSDHSPADRTADFDSQGGSARPGGEAAGGIDPKPGDPAHPDAEADDKARRAMRDKGFGDHKGAEL